MLPFPIPTQDFEIKLVRITENDGKVTTTDGYLYESDAWKHARSIIESPYEGHGIAFGMQFPEAKTVRHVIELFNEKMENEGRKARLHVLTIKVQCCENERRLERMRDSESAERMGADR